MILFSGTDGGAKNGNVLVGARAPPAVPPIPVRGIRGPLLLPKRGLKCTLFWLYYPPKKDNDLLFGSGHVMSMPILRPLTPSKGEK